MAKDEVSEENRAYVREVVIEGTGKRYNVTFMLGATNGETQITEKVGKQKELEEVLKKYGLDKGGKNEIITLFTTASPSLGARASKLYDEYPLTTGIDMTKILDAQRKRTETENKKMRDYVGGHP